MFANVLVAAFTLASLLALFSEVRANRQTLPLTPPGAPATGVADFAYAPSAQAQTATLLLCARALEPNTAGLVASGQLQRNAGRCARFATRVLDSSPANGLAWFVDALAAQVAGDRPRRARDLARSVAFAPFEGWLAQRRLSLELSAGNLQTRTAAHDIATLLKTQAGAELLARYHVHFERTRAAIDTAALSATPRDQRRLRNQIIRARQ